MTSLVEKNNHYVSVENIKESVEINKAKQNEVLEKKNNNVKDNTLKNYARTTE